MLRCSVARRPAAEAEVAAAIASIGAGPGIYFGCDAGIAGLHPLQAVVLAHAAVALHVFEDGVVATALDAFGQALLAHPAWSGFAASSGRGCGRSPLNALRGFLRPLKGTAEACLVGALRFDAHRLADSTGRAVDGVDSPALGVFYFAPTLLCRGAAGTWEHVDIEFADAALADVRGKTAVPVAMVAAAARDRRGGRLVDDDFQPGGYAAVVDRAVQMLARGPLVSLTLSQSFRRPADEHRAAAAFETLRRANPAPATFFFHASDTGERVFGASPDLQLRVHGRDVEAFPVCGTVARGHGPVGEADSFRRLIDEDVDAASLAVCSDALRNDLAPLCVPGSLRLCDRRRPMALATVVHTVDRLKGRLREGADAWDAIVATAAPVMATGTPRRLALAAIGTLEAGPRGWYGGLVARVGADGDALVGTILRAAAMRDGVAEVRTGGDLLADSAPAREEEESRIKAVSLWRALGLEVAADLEATLAGDVAPRVASAPDTASTPIAPSASARVALCDMEDAFAPAMRDSLLGLGYGLDAAATVRVLIGGGDPDGVVTAAQEGGLVAVGDAAAPLLREAGFAVRPIRPEHGRVIRCLPVEGAPWQPGRAFFVARYAAFELAWAGDLDAGERADWKVWLQDDRGRPLLIAHRGRRSVCVLFRPESLLSDDLAREALRAAIDFAAAPA